MKDRTSYMLQRALDMVPSVGSIPIVIVGKNNDHVLQLMHDFGTLAWEAGYRVKATSKYGFLVDEEAVVRFVTRSAADRNLRGQRFVDIFVDHYAEDHLPANERITYACSTSC